jgi:endonuclease-8
MMPEGDTVLVAARRLHAALAGEEIRRTDFRVPRYSTVDLSGQSLTEVAARGKHLLMRTSGGVTIHSHFKMEGTWHLYRPGDRWKGPGFQVRAVIETEPWLAVGFRLGRLDVWKTREEDRHLAHLGPDVLGPDWDPGEVLLRLRAQPERQIGTALLDQRTVAGPGNIYKSETCFLHRVDPFTPVGQIKDLEGLVSLLKSLMEANRERGQQVTTGDWRRSRAHWVAGRAGLPCRRCGSTIKAGEQESYEGERITYWCPTCQARPQRA